MNKYINEEKRRRADPGNRNSRNSGDTAGGLFAFQGNDMSDKKGSGVIRAAFLIALLFMILHLATCH